MIEQERASLKPGDYGPGSWAKTQWPGTATQMRPGLPYPICLGVDSESLETTQSKENRHDEQHRTHAAGAGCRSCLRAGSDPGKSQLVLTRQHRGRLGVHVYRNDIHCERSST